MHRSRSSIPYDILHGIQFPANISSVFAYLSYFPPPPPVLPGPPPSRSWTCSSRSYSSSSCLISDDRNPPSLRLYPPVVVQNQSEFFMNITHSPKLPPSRTNSSTGPETLYDLFQNHFTLILLLIIILSVFIFVIFLLLFLLYLHRLRQRSSTNSFSQININSNNQSISSSHNVKNKKLYHSLIPYRRKHSKRLNPTTVNNSNDDKNFFRLTNHQGTGAIEVMGLAEQTRRRINEDEEQEETL